MRKNSKKAGVEILLLILAALLCFYIAEKTDNSLQIQDKELTVILENTSQQEERDELIQKWAKEYAEKWKEEFVPQTNKDSSFPDELVVMMEEALYDSDAANMQEPENPYQEVIRQLGGEEYLLTMEELYYFFPETAAYREDIKTEEELFHYLSYYYNTVPLYCQHAFHLSMAEGQDNYIFVRLNERKTVLVTERTGDEFNLITEFEILKDKEGRVIRYGDEFYYVFLYSAFNGRDYDGIGICRLADKWVHKTLSIRYQPDAFSWEKLYTAYESPRLRKEMDAYIEQLEKNLLSGNYLGIKGEFGEKDVYFGDEIRSELITVAAADTDDIGEAYQVDLANCGEPVYVWKKHDQFNSLQVRFYDYDSRTKSDVELADARIYGTDKDSGTDLVQMWFKEIEGKIYTFRMYYVSDYSYMMNVSLIEKNDVKTIRTYLLLPHKEFIVKEKKE